MLKKKELKNGRREGEKTKELEIVKSLIKMGMTTEQIMEATKLTKNEIETIKKSLK